MLKSTTAIKKGFGSMPHRYVIGLTDNEKSAVKSGETVYFKINKTSYMQSGYKIVTVYCGRFDSREPTDTELMRIEQLEEGSTTNG